MKNFDLNEIELHEIKSSPLTEVEVDRLASKAGSYEALFSRRARKFRELGLQDKSLGEKDFKPYLLLDYTFLKRPVLETELTVLAGNSKPIVDAMKAEI